MNLNEFFSYVTKSGHETVDYLISGSGSYTYGDLYTAMKRLNAWYYSNAAQSKNVLIATDDTWVQSVVIFTNLFSGRISFIADPGTTTGDLKELAKFTAADILIVNSTEGLSLPDDLVALTPGPVARKTGSLLSKFIKSSSPSEADNKNFAKILSGTVEMEFENIPSDPDDTAYVLFTSGTTSAPKGVVQSYRALTDHISTFRKVYGYKPGDRLLNLLPVHHADGLIQGLFLNALCGSTWVRPFSFSIQQIPDLMNAFRFYNITHFISVPTILAFMQKYAEGGTASLSGDQFKFTVSCAAKLESKLWSDFQETFGKPLYNMYGLTETVTGGIFSGPDAGSYQIGTIGKPVDCSVQLDPESGELLMSGSSLMKEYFKNPGQTSAVLKNGWLHTGDIAEIDENGFVKITGRKKNIIIRGGVNVYPEEITEVANNHPDVLESVTVGLIDELWGERVVTLIHAKKSDSAMQSAIREFIKQKLPAEKMPDEIQFTGELPKGPSGKVKLNEAVELAKNSNPMVEAVGQNKPGIENRVIAVAAKAFGTNASALTVKSMAINTKGWDSLGHMNLVTALEKEFNVKFSTREVISIDSLETAIKLINAK